MCLFLETAYPYRDIGFPPYLERLRNIPRIRAASSVIGILLFSNGPLCRTISVSPFLPRALLRSLCPCACVSLSVAPSLSLFRRPCPRPTVSQSTEILRPITRFLLLFTVRRPVGLSDTSRGRIRGRFVLGLRNQRPKERATNVSLAEKFRTSRESRAARRECTEAFRGTVLDFLVASKQPITHWPKRGRITHPPELLRSQERFSNTPGRSADTLSPRFRSTLAKNQHHTSPRFYRYLGRCLSAAHRFALYP